MCNAYQHTSTCTCGFGGEGHRGRREHGDLPVALETLSAHWRSADSFVNPNAQCPACGAPVYFYASPDGGRVFFDELGPPWPKHPCTDDGRPSRRPLALRPAVRPVAERTAYSWQAKGWTPFLPDDIREYTRELFYVGGNWNDGRQVLYVLRCGPLLEGDTVNFWPGGLWQLRRHDDGFQASIWNSGLSSGIRRVYSSALEARAALSRTGSRSARLTH